MTFYLKQDNTSSSVQINLLDENDDAVDVSGATVRFHVVNAYGAVLVDEAMTIVTAASGIVRYDWATDDLPQPGILHAEVEVTYADGTIQSFPNNSYFVIEVERKLA